MREPSKRHSWSPKTTTTSSVVAPMASPAAAPVMMSNAEPSAPTITAEVEDVRASASPLKTEFTARSSVLAKVLVDNKKNNMKLPEAPPPLKSRGFVCETEPLVDDSKEFVVDEEELSDAGTYTLDGDNYTEEQKEMMDIDNLRKERQELSEEESSGIFLKCKPLQRQLQRPTSFEPSLEVSLRWRF